ncbi:glucose-6-phosphate dehydrogenase [Paenisporosarcina quisquiliarum]|uniref:Glucose-6-phosphate 1-dehydrogenase n=1 Tax=Paenisporosarcina quisquiliarum TaxID=365346 RepID=A0A9X3RE66_9BACL|nr:glucose-6-phosphate dehydrogenase [Paenisporosarcina quisquiliarum]MCZ8538560.1 glucose-6-phosphate dehydrogenase [Paenisporosarcina quisquiliarum]
MQDMTFVLFGATGDLAQRKLFPALYNLYLDGRLPENISIVGLGRNYCSNEDFQSKVERAVQAYSRRTVQPSGLQDFLSKFRYCAFDVTDKESYHHLHELIDNREIELGIPQNRLFYLSVGPSLVDVITSNLNSSGICQNNGWKRLIVEKPFGSDLETARQLNKNLSKTFNEEEIYRIDHYLGKPMVQNLETLVLANPALKSLLDHKQISNVQITASETVGVETRADYYDKAGAIRDMVQNHLLQLVMMTAIYLPEKITANEIRVKKMEIIESLRPLLKENAYKDVVRGQYESGDIQGTPVFGYKEEPGVDDSSKNDTYFAARLYIDNPSWSGIPFYIRTGKRLNQKSTRIVIEFKNNMKDSDVLQGLTPNLLILEISPNESISLRVNMKDPSSNRFEPVWINFSTNSESLPEAYELLLFDAMLGNATFFSHWKEVELSWEWIQPLLEAYQENLLPLYSYPAGSTGPEEANQLLQSKQFKWW